MSIDEAAALLGIDEAIAIIAEYEQCKALLAERLMALPPKKYYEYDAEQPRPNDVVRADGSILRYEVYLTAQSARSRFEAQKEPAKKGRPRNPTLAAAEGYAMALFQQAQWSKNKAAEKAAELYADKKAHETVKQTMEASIRNYLQSKAKDSRPL